MSADTCDRAFELADTHGTPLLVFSPERLQAAVDRLRTFTAQLPLPTEVYYSYKTNYLPDLCARLSDCDMGAEVTSVLEYELARRYCTPPRIVVNGIGKMAGLLQQTTTGTRPRLVNLETDTEIDHLCRLAAEGEPLRVGLRVCLPGVSGERSSDPSVHWRRGAAKFGWDSADDDVILAARAVDSNPATILDALHVHAGSQVVSADFYETVLRETCALLLRLRTAGITTVTTLDLGGGLASGWVSKRRTGPLFETLHAAGLQIPVREQRAADLDGIAAVFQRNADRLHHLGVSRLILEPGRFLAEPAMTAVATVIAVRRDGTRRHAVLDLGTNALHCWRSDETRLIVFNHPAPTGAAVPWTVVGPLCHRSDTFGTVQGPADLQPGTRVCLEAVGAYSIGDWIANTWLRPPVVASDGTVLWRRQNADDFLSLAHETGKKVHVS
jgi:diaminopimelate decarboxylase